MLFAARVETTPCIHQAHSLEELAKCTVGELHVAIGNERASTPPCRRRSAFLPSRCPSPGSDAVPALRIAVLGVCCKWVQLSSAGR